MPVYYFHLRDGVDVLLDPDGRALAGIEAAITATLREARAIIGADALEGKIALDQRIDVEDQTGLIVHSLQFEAAVRITRGDPY